MAPFDPAQIGDRYELEALIGQGGMARVYRARDLTNGSRVALKQLALDPQSTERSTPRALFEREFHTLTQLRHPHVITVHDYGIGADDLPYYTMELLDGGDIGERAPLAWGEACRVAFEVCSALALLHSRRLLHRDLSPRNIRCTLSGRAKLIDFGAMVPMSAGGTNVVGTPAFTAPETLRRLALDARTDLFSLGATLYFTLTGRAPYPARTFADLSAAWSGSVPPPSNLVPGIPAALDDLVLALVNPEPELRPQSAFEVMQLLAACSGYRTDESEAVPRAYLVTPSLVGRSELLTAMRERLARAKHCSGVLILGELGVGRSRFLDACSLEAQALGFTVLRASASGARASFAVAHALASHLVEALPQSADPALTALFESDGSLRKLGGSDVDAAAVQDALSRWLQTQAAAHPLFIGVDDAQRVDPSSAALLAALLDKAHTGRICIALTADSAEASNDTVPIFARRCHNLPLQPLDKEETHQLFASVFGDVAHLQMLSDEIYRIALGNPKQSMELAQWFLDRGVVQYAAGTWTLPARLNASDLPSSVGEALQARIAGLSENARFLAEAHALAYYDELIDRQYHELLPGLSSRDVEQALTELLWVGALATDGIAYTLTSRAWSAALLDRLTPAEIEQRHRALAAMYEPRSTMATAHHAFSGGLDELGLNAMQAQHSSHAKGYDHKKLLELNVGKMMWCSGPAITTAQRLGYSARAIHDLRRWHFAGSITVESGVYDESAQIWFERLAHDSGLALYRADQETAAPDARLMRALTLAHQRYLETPEPERVYSVEEAIRFLGEYVVYSIALGVRSIDIPLIRSLPAVLEPFIALSPILEVLWRNALATMRSQCDCRYEVAHELWMSVLEKLETMTSAEFPHIEALRSAVMFGVALSELQLGRSTASAWAKRLDADPYQRVSAIHIRKIERLEQGDRRGAENLRRKAEVLSLQMRSPQMFHSVLQLESIACVNARDISGLRDALEHMKPLAARHSGWKPSLAVTEGYFQLIRGDAAAAKPLFESWRELCKPNEQGESRNLWIWLMASHGLGEVLLQTDRAAEAYTIVREALDLCDERNIVGGAADLQLTLGLIEAKLGNPEAAARVDAEIARQEQAEVTGIRMGLSYEARARIAICMDDRNAFDHFAALTARAYRHGARSPLAARYARLLNDAARHGWQAQTALTRLENFATSDSMLASSELVSLVKRSLATNHSAQRTHGVLTLICSELGSDVGHLYLFAQNGLVLSSSHGEVAVPALSVQVEAWVRQERTRAAELDELETGELTGDGAPVTLVHADVRSYELQALRCLVGGVPTLVGVAALGTRSTEAPTTRHIELLQLLAEHLVHAGDTRGFTLPA